MGISIIGDTTGANNFAIAVGSSGNEVVVLDREYPAGSYSISSQLSDTSMDIYAVSNSGALVGHTVTTALSCSSGFNKMVVIGATNNDLLSFEYKTTYSPTEKGTVAAASPYVTAVDPSYAVNEDDTVTITGGNFSSSSVVTFTGTDNVALTAKSVVRVSSTELLVTRPDSFSVANSPYTITVTNPDIPTAQGTRHRLSNAVTAGANPAWQTSAILTPYWVGNGVSLAVEATDNDNSAITYSVHSGTLPAGLSLNSSTGAITGNSSGAEATGTTTLVTIRATDEGNNYLDREFTFTANSAPTWVTTSGGQYNQETLPQFVATPAISGTALTYSIVSGTLGEGLSLSSNGQVLGSVTNAEQQTIVVRATDAYGAFADQELTLTTTFNEYLYLNGDQYNSVTGGWSQLYSSGGSSTFNSNHIYMSVPSINSHDVAVATNSAVDLTNYSTLEVYWTTTDVPYAAGFGIIPTRTSLRSITPTASTSRDRSQGAGQTGFQRQTLDISSYTGNYFIYVATFGAENLSWNGYIAGGNTSTYEVILKA